MNVDLPVDQLHGLAYRTLPIPRLFHRLDVLVLRQGDEVHGLVVLSNPLGHTIGHLLEVLDDFYCRLAGQAFHIHSSYAHGLQLVHTKPAGRHQSLQRLAC